MISKNAIYGDIRSSFTPERTLPIVVGCGKCEWILEQFKCINSIAIDCLSVSVCLPAFHE